MAQLVQCMHKDLILDHQHSHKNWVWHIQPVEKTWEAEARDRAIPRVHWPVSLVKAMSSKFIERLCLKI